jgi:hypothetical protein
MVRRQPGSAARNRLESDVGFSLPAQQCSGRVASSFSKQSLHPAPIAVLLVMIWLCRYAVANQMRGVGWSA